ncbi:hypothetical protein ACWDSJ_27880 [Nocardia sp. NPDC003482]
MTSPSAPHVLASPDPDRPAESSRDDAGGGASPAAAAGLRVVPAAPAGTAARADDDAVAEFLAVADGAGTTHAYRAGWRDFVGWCEQHGYAPLPASSQTVARYLAAAARRAHRPLSTSTLAVYRSAIGRAHRDADLPDPTRDTRVTRVLTGIRRRRTAAGEIRDAAPPAELDQLRTMVRLAHESARTWRAQVAARRDIALLLLGWATADRRGELAGLRGADLRPVPHHDGGHRLRIRLRGSKTSPTATEDQYVDRGGPDALYCPWCAVLRWLAVLDAHDTAAAAERGRQRLAGTAEIDEDAVTDAASIAVQRLLRRDADRNPHTHRCAGTWPRLAHPELPVFRSLARSDGGLPRSPEPIDGRSIARIVAARARKAGFGPLRGHSLRAGRATDLFDRGASAEQVMAVTRHRRLETALLYDRRRAQRSGDVPHGL